MLKKLDIKETREIEKYQGTKPTSDDREETKKPVKAQATSKVVNLTQQTKQPKFCHIQEIEEASSGQEAGENDEGVQIFSST